MSVARASVTHPHGTVTAAQPYAAAPAMVQAPPVFAAQAVPAQFAGAAYGGFTAPGAADGFAAHQAGVSAPPPQPPRRMTDGMPTPEDVSLQKQKYALALDSQLDQGRKTIQEQTEQAKIILRQSAEEKKMAFALQVEEQLMQKEMNLDQDTHQKLMELHQAAHTQKAKLEQQASGLTLDFRQKQMLEQMEFKRYDMQMKQCDMRERMERAHHDKQHGLVHNFDGMPAQPPTEQPYAAVQMPEAAAPTMPAAVPYHPGPPPTAVAAAAGGSAQAPIGQPYEASTPPAASGQYHSAQFAAPAEATSGVYGAPPTAYAQPQTAFAAPPTAAASGHYSQHGSMAPPATSMGAHQMPTVMNGHVPQTVLPQGH